MNTDEKVCPFCAEIIKASAIVCKHCGKNLQERIAPIPSVSPPPIMTITMQQPLSPQVSKKKTGCLKIGLYIFAGMIALGIIANIMQSARRAVDPEYARLQDEARAKRELEEAAEARENARLDAERMAEKAIRDKEAQEKAARLEAAVPKQQKDFIAAIADARNEFNKMENEIQQERTRDARRNAIRGILNSYAIEDWFGTVTTVSTNSDGLGILVITINDRPEIEIATWNNALSDIMDNTLIPKSSSVYNTMADIKRGDKVWFSGQFVPSERDLIKEGSMTLDGSMNNPSYKMRFTRLKVFE